MASYIYFDVDGVLNAADSDTGDGFFPVLDDDKMQLLSELASSCDAKLVMISSWKEYLEGNILDEEVGEFILSTFAGYDMEISDITVDNGFNRGVGILNHITENAISSFCILDDETFDYESCGLLDHLVKTTFFAGLTADDVAEAERLLCY